MEITPELKKDLSKYIGKERKRGFSDDKIKTALIKAGYKKKDLNPLFQKSGKVEVAKSFDMKNVGKVLTVIFLVLFIGFIAYAFLNNECDTIDCFIEHANECKPTSLEVDDSGTIHYYEIQDNCVFYREYTKLADDEPQEVVDLLLGKSLTCNYALGEFNTDWVNTISIGLEDCEGELVDSMNVIIAAVS